MTSHRSEYFENNSTNSLQQERTECQLIRLTPADLFFGWHAEITMSSAKQCHFSLPIYVDCSRNMLYANILIKSADIEDIFSTNLHLKWIFLNIYAASSIMCDSGWCHYLIIMIMIKLGIKKTNPQQRIRCTRRRMLGNYPQRTRLRQ